MELDAFGDILYSQDIKSNKEKPNNKLEDYLFQEPIAKKKLENPEEAIFDLE